MGGETTQDLAERLRAELYTVLDDDPAGLDELRASAVTRLGVRHPSSLLIAAKCERARSRRRPVQRSLDAWAELLTIAEGVLAPLDPVLMEIVSARDRWLGRRAEPGDLDGAVRAHSAELERRSAGLEADDHWIGVARADLAAALIDRARLAGLAADGPARDPAADLHRARGLAEQEVARRTRLHGEDHLFTWQAKGVRGAALLGLAAYGGEGLPRDGRAADIAETTLSFITGRRPRAGSHLMSAWSLRAEALLSAGMTAEGERAGRRAAALSAARPGAWSGGVAPGRPWLLLAAALVGRGDADGARLAARRASRERSRWFPAASLYRIEAERGIGSPGG